MPPDAHDWLHAWLATLPPCVKWMCQRCVRGAWRLQQLAEWRVLKLQGGLAARLEQHPHHGHYQSSVV